MDKFLALDGRGFLQWKKNALAFNAVQISKMTMLSQDSLQAMAHDAVKKKCASAAGKKIPNCNGSLREAFNLKPNDRNVMLGWINSIDAGRMWCLAHTHSFEADNTHQVYKNKEVKGDERRAIFARHNNVLFSTFFKPHAGLQPRDCATGSDLNTPNIGWLKGVLSKRIPFIPKVSLAGKPGKKKAGKRPKTSQRPRVQAKRPGRAERPRPTVRVKRRPSVKVKRRPSVKVKRRPSVKVKERPKAKSKGRPVVRVKPRPQTSGQFRNSVLRLQHSKKCLDVPNGTKRNGAPIVQHQCHRRPNQRWTMDKAGRIVSVGTGKCLEVRAGRKANGAKVFQNACSRKKTQVWQMNRQGQLRSRANGGCLDVPGASKANGTRLQTYRCHRGANQRFSTR